tara:strand:+ start:134 stop:331 length:198 start_codon:yes stop_codon:yes gene_type:complete
MNDLKNIKFKSGLTYEESMVLAEKYISSMSLADHKSTAIKYFGELLREVPMWRNIANDILTKEAK